jgi:hypothetical protein
MVYLIASTYRRAESNVIRLENVVTLPVARRKAVRHA